MANETTIDKETARRLLLILSLEGDVKREEIEWALGIIHQIPGYTGITLAKAVQDRSLKEILVAIAAEQISPTTPKDLKALIEDAEERKAALKTAKETGEKRAEEFIEAAEKAAKTKAQIKVPPGTPETPVPIPETAPPPPSEEPVSFGIKITPAALKAFGESVGKATTTPFKLVSFFSPPKVLAQAPQTTAALASAMSLSQISAKAEGLPDVERKQLLRFVENFRQAEFSFYAQVKLQRTPIPVQAVTILMGSEFGMTQGEVVALVHGGAPSEKGPSFIGRVGQQIFGGLAQKAVTKAATKAVTSALTKAGISITAKAGAAAAGTVVAPGVGTLIGLAVGLLVDKGKDLLSWVTRNAPKVAIGLGALLFGTGFVFQSPILMGTGGALAAGGFVGQAGGVGPALSMAGGVASSVIGGITSLTVASIATPLIVALISIPVLVAIILFIINSGAYLVPPGPARFGGIPPGGNLTKCNPNETGTEITEQLATSVDSGSVRFLPDYLGSRREGLCMTPTMIILHTSGGYDNDQGNSATYETLVSRDRSCQLATDTNDTIFMLSFFEKQVESAWCSDDLNAGGVGIEMAGECQGGCAPVAKCSPNTSLTYQPGGPHPCPDLEDLSFDAICKTMQYYKIPWSQVFQHEASNGSHVDPIGDEWVDKFILRLKNNCRV